MKTLSKAVCKLIKEKKILQGCYGRFIIGPIQKGQAVSYATTLRHLLLDIRGPELTHVWIRNLNTELDTMKGLRESAVDVIDHLARVIIGGYTGIQGNSLESIDRFQNVHVIFHGPGVFTAQDIDLKPPFTIINPDQYIATLDKESILEMVLCIEYTRLYTHTMKVLPLPSLKIPSRNPVIKNTSMKVLNLAGDKEQCVILEVWTNGAVSPSEALNIACTKAYAFYGSLLPKQN